VLVGSLEPWSLREPGVSLGYDAAQIERQMILGYDGVARLAAGALRITDDNQLLSYGVGRFARGAEAGLAWAGRLTAENTALLRAAAGDGR
jgi:hypothetical protein